MAGRPVPVVEQLWYSCPLQSLNDVYLFLGRSLEFSKPPSSNSRKARIECIPVPYRFITLCATWYMGRFRTVGKSLCNSGSFTLFSVECAELPNSFHFEDSVLIWPVDAWKRGHYVAWNIRIWLPIDVATYPRETESSAILLWKLDRTGSVRIPQHWGAFT